MILLTATNETLRLETTAALSTDYTVAFADHTSTTFVPGSSQGNVVTAASTDIVASPAASTQRQVKMITVRNRDATSTQTIAIKKHVAASDFYLIGAIQIGPGEFLTYLDHEGFRVYTASGQLKNSQTVNDATINNNFGSGADGNLTISAGVTTLTRDMYWNNLTINGTGQINTAGYRIYVAGTLDISAAPASAIFRTGNNGGAGAAGGGAGAAGAIQAAVDLGGGDAGSAGGGGNAAAGAQGAAPGTTTPSNGGAGGQGSAGGTGTGGAGGALRGGGAATNPSLAQLIVRYFLRGATLVVGGAGGAGGGGGGGNGAQSGSGGGGGGGGGGNIFIAANTINRGASTAVGAINSVGGNGGAGGSPANAGAAGGGGAGGGGGGYVYIFYQTLLGATGTNIITVAGGAGGNGGNGNGAGGGGNGGFGGTGGMITIGNIASNTWTLVTGAAGSSGTNAVGATGGTGGAGGVAQASI